MESKRAGWEHRFAHPAVLASIIAGLTGLGVAISSAISGSITAHYQAEAEKAKLKADMLLTLARLPDLKQRSNATLALLRSGILEDRDGKVCRAFVDPDASGNCKPPN
ncbi:MAG TPA: hypothetical protein VEK73_06900 [Xanthobacteraceae bacterium]|nr:hypothetical protein [Xanthobacteraceae bacterium]